MVKSECKFPTFIGILVIKHYIKQENEDKAKSTKCFQMGWKIWRTIKSQQRNNNKYFMEIIH